MQHQIYELMRQTPFSGADKAANVEKSLRIPARQLLQPEVCGISIILDFYITSHTKVTVRSIQILIVDKQAV